MKKLTNFFKKLWKDESGQGATEYILLLVVIVGIIIVFKDPIKKMVGDKVSELSSAVSEIKPQQ